MCVIRITVHLNRREFGCFVVHSNPPGKFLLMNREVVIKTSGVFKSLWLEQDGSLISLN